MRAIVRHLPNVHDPHDQVACTVEPGRRLSEYLEKGFAPPDRLGVILDGQPVRGDDVEQLELKDGSELIFYDSPSAGAIASLVIGIVISAAASGINYAIARANAVKSPEFDESPTYGFDQLLTTVRPGTKIPVIYGTARVGGHRLGQFLSNALFDPDFPAGQNANTQNGALNTLIALGSGPYSAIKDIQIDGNAVENYPGAVVETRLGAAHQAPIPGWQDQRVSTTHQVDVTNTGGAVTATTVDVVDAFEVVLKFPQGLFRVSSGGDIRHAEVDATIEYRVNGAATAFTSVDLHFAYEKQTAHSFFWRSPDLDRAQYEIKVTRLTIDDAGTRNTSLFQLHTITDIIDEEISYPGIGLLSVKQLPSSQVSGNAPNYSALVDGRIVHFYSTPTTKFPFFSDNPAWCLLDFLLDKKNGLGSVIPEDRIDVQSFMDWAAFCEEMVDINDGAGQEKRARLSLVIDGSISALEVIKQICAVGMASLRFSGGTYSISIDRDEPYVQLFSMGRIGINSFQVTLPQRGDKPNSFVGRIWPEDLDYEEDSTEPVTDPELGPEQEVVTEEVNLVGVPSRHQAQRLLTYYLLGQKFNRRLVEFSAFADAIVCEAGDVIAVSHDVPGWGYSGVLRWAAGDGTQVLLDRDVTLEAGKSYQIAVGHADGEVEVREVTTFSGQTTDRIATAGAWSQLPAIGEHYSFGEVDKVFVLYRVLSIRHDPQNPIKRFITAREHHKEVFEDDIHAIPEPSITRLPDPRRIPAQATDLLLRERLRVNADGTVENVIDVYYNLPAESGVFAAIYYRDLGVTDGAWLLSGETPAEVFVVEGVVRDVTYEVSVVTVSAFGARRQPGLGVTDTITITGSTHLPDDVTGFAVSRTPEGLTFTWDAIDPVDNPDLDYYEIRQGADWFTARRVGTSIITEHTIAGAVPGSNTYLIKARNKSGNYSQNADVVVFTVDPRFGENIIFTRQEDPTWSGTKSGTTVVSDELTWPGVSGTYTTAKFEVSSGDPVTAIILTESEHRLVDVSLTWNSSTETWDSGWAQEQTWDAGTDADINWKVEMRFSENTSSDVDFGPWQTRPVSFTAAVKWAQVRLSATIVNEFHVLKVEKLRIHFDVPELPDSGTVTTDSGGTELVAFEQTYNEPPRVVATIVSAAAGDELLIQNITADDFEVGVKNGGNFVGRDVNWQSSGF